MHSEQPAFGVAGHFRRIRRNAESLPESSEKQKLLASIYELGEELGVDANIDKLISTARDAATQAGAQEVSGELGQLAAMVEDEEREREKPLPGFLKLSCFIGGAGIVVGLLLVFLFWLAAPALTETKAASRLDQALTRSGTFGDTFGMINAIISTLAFAGVLYTLWTQRKELALQREEVRNTRKEANRSADALHKQVQLSAQVAKMSGLAAVSQYYENILKGKMPTFVDAQEWGYQRQYSELMRDTLSRLLHDDLNLQVVSQEEYQAVIDDCIDMQQEFWEKIADSDRHNTTASNAYNVVINTLQVLATVECMCHPNSSAAQGIEGIKRYLSDVQVNNRGTGHDAWKKVMGTLRDRLRELKDKDPRI